METSWGANFNQPPPQQGMSPPRDNMPDEPFSPASDFFNLDCWEFLDSEFFGIPEFVDISEFVNISLKASDDLGQELMTSFNKPGTAYCWEDMDVDTSEAWERMDLVAEKMNSEFLDISKYLKASDDLGQELTLREVAVERVDQIANKMKDMPQQKLEEIKTELLWLFREGLSGDESSNNANEFFHLQKLLEGRDDLTPATLSLAHQVQLEVLFAIKTGSPMIMHRSHIMEVLLDNRCRNIACLIPLPDCKCHICAGNNGYCRRCICVICSQYDFEESNSCHRIYCCSCFHWAHTDCAVSGGWIGVGHTAGDGMVLFRCHACQRESKLFAWVRRIFEERLTRCEWNTDALSRQLGYACKIFHLSHDSDERRFSTKCAELIESLTSGSDDDDSMCRSMLLQTLQEMDDHDKIYETLERILIGASAEPIELSYAFLQKITDGFSQEIGSGGFGVVYKGVIRNKEVAIKKLNQTKQFSDKQFEDELACLRRVKHENIVRFLGYCSDTQKVTVEHKGQYVVAEDRRRFLCFEYAPNRSLRDYLRAESQGQERDTHYKFIEGICHGLHYLHKEERITHLDLKPENILIDAHMVPKITDFGLSRRFSGAQSKIITITLRATPGYSAPEYWSRGQISFKADIFSLGIVIKEIFGGSIHSPDDDWYQSQMIDCPQMERCIKISKRCVDDDPRKRPTMDCIIDMLSEKET